MPLKQHRHILLSCYFTNPRIWFVMCVFGRVYFLNEIGQFFSHIATHYTCSCTTHRHTHTNKFNLILLRPTQIYKYSVDLRFNVFYLRNSLDLKKKKIWCKRIVISHTHQLHYTRRRFFFSFLIFLCLLMHSFHFVFISHT